MKKLADLNPKFYDTYGGREKVGMNFDCPGCGERIGVKFNNPISPGPDIGGWQRTGESFEGMTIRPSIHVTGGCGWHGWLTHGELREVSE